MKDPARSWNGTLWLTEIRPSQRPPTTPAAIALPRHR